MAIKENFILCDVLLSECSDAKDFVYYMCTCFRIAIIHFSFHVYFKTYSGCYIINWEMCYNIQGDIFHLWIGLTKDISTIETHSKVNAGLYWSSRRAESVLLRIFQSNCSSCYFKELDIWILFVINKSVVKIELFWAITQRVVGIPFLRFRIQEVYGTDTVVCFAGYPVLRSPPRFVSSTVTTLTVRLDDFSYDGDGHPTKYVLQYMVSGRITTCSSRCFRCEC